MAIDKDLVAELQLWTVEELKKEKASLEETLEVSPHDKTSIELLDEIEKLLIKRGIKD